MEFQIPLFLFSELQVPYYGGVAKNPWEGKNREKD